MTQELADQIMLESPVEVRSELAFDQETGAQMAYRRLMQRMDQDVALLLRAGVEFVRLQFVHDACSVPPIVLATELFMERSDIGRVKIARYEVEVID